MMTIKRADFVCPIDGPVCRWLLYDTRENRAPAYSKGEVLVRRGQVEVVGPLFPMNVEAARVVAAVIERAALQADWVRCGGSAALPDSFLDRARQVAHSRSYVGV